MERREFLLLALTAASGILISACAGGGGRSDVEAKAAPGGGHGDCSGGAATTYMNPGHPHTTVNLTVAQVLAAVPGDYTLLAGSHSHSFTLTAADFVTLRAGQVIQNRVESDGLEHGHEIDIVCT